MLWSAQNRLLAVISLSVPIAAFSSRAREQRPHVPSSANVLQREPVHVTPEQRVEHTQNGGPADRYDFSAVERRIKQELDKRSIPSVVVSVAKDGRIVYERAFGYADVEQKILATVTTAYRLGSISKPLTATGLMVLHQKGQVHLDSAAERYIRPLKFQRVRGDRTPVAVRQLLNHTSGLPPYFQYAFEGFQKDADTFRAAFAKYGVIVQPPGTLMEYSNMGYGLLGEIIAEQSGQPFPAFMREQVFEPLGMTSSFFDEAPIKQIRTAVGYSGELKRLPPVFNNTSGAGNGYSSAHDLMLFAMFHLRPQTARRPILTPANVSLMSSYVEPGALSPLYGATTRYGLGWYFRDDSGSKAIWHEGGMPGASAYLKMIPRAQLAAAAVTNVGDKNALVESLVNDLLKVILPSYSSEPLNPTANYTLYAGSGEYLGSWSGVISIKDREIPCTLTFDSAGAITISYGSPDGARAPIKAQFRGLIQGPSFLGSFPGSWPNDDIPPGATPIVVLHVIRDGTVLSGRINAYGASTQTLQFFYPSYIRLERGKSS